MTGTGMWVSSHAARRRCAVLAAALLAAGSLTASVATCSASSLPGTLHPLAAQTSDEAIRSDLGAIDGWRAKVDTLSGSSKDLWRAAAARAWLTAARAEYVENDETGFPQAAFARAVTLIGEIESGQAPVTRQTVPVAVPPVGTAKVADSLYVVLESLKHHEFFLCAAEELANMEMELAWTGNETVDQGDCWSSPHFARARELAQMARIKVETCQAVEVAPRETPKPVVVHPDTAVPVPALEIPTVEELQIPRNVHFALAKDEIGTTSFRVIKGIADLLLKYPSITVRMEGHTDSRGNVAYNLDLSRRRVMAARNVFIALGVDSSRITYAFKGKSELFAPEDSKRGYALNRRVEMVFVDSEGRDIKTEHQEGDIQLEGDRAKSPTLNLVAPRPATHRTTAPKPAGTSARVDTTGRLVAPKPVLRRPPVPRLAPRPGTPGAVRDTTRKRSGG